MKVFLKRGNYWDHDFSNEIPLFISNMKLEMNQIYNFNSKYYIPCYIDRKNDYVIIEEIKLNQVGEEYNYENNIKCPYCGYEDSDSWEAGDSSDEKECGRCGLLFSYERNIEITYSSNPIKQNIKIITIGEDHETCNP